MLLHEQPAVGRRSGRRLFLATAMAAAAWGSSLLSSRMTAMAPVGASPAGWDTMVVAVPSVAVLFLFFLWVRGGSFWGY